jgi:hypothetical protein
VDCGGVRGNVVVCYRRVYRDISNSNGCVGLVRLEEKAGINSLCANRSKYADGLARDGHQVLPILRRQNSLGLSILQNMRQEAPLTVRA